MRGIGKHLVPIDNANLSHPSDDRWSPAWPVPLQVSCVLCHARTAGKAFLPCEHACVCEECMNEHKIGPFKDTREKKKVG